MRLLINDYGIFVGVKRGYFLIKAKERVNIAPSKIDQIIILTGGASFSSAALRLALKHMIPISIHTSDGRLLGLLKGLESANVLLRKKQYEAKDNEKGIELAKKFAIAKLNNQKVLLQQYSRSRRIKELEEASYKISEYIEKIKKVEGNEIRKKLMKLEAEAAKIYWENFKYLVKAEFEKRLKRFDKPKDPVNLCLNYGYSILASQVWLAIDLVGLDAYAGFLHEDSPRRPALVMDLMEEFRQPVIDRAVIKFINSLNNPDQIIEKGFLKREYRRELVKTIFERLDENIYYKERRQSILSHIYSQAKDISQFLLDRSRSYVPFMER